MLFEYAGNKIRALFLAVPVLFCTAAAAEFNDTFYEDEFDRCSLIEIIESVEVDQVVEMPAVKVETDKENIHEAGVKPDVEEQSPADSETSRIDKRMRMNISQLAWLLARSGYCPAGR